VAKLLAIFLFLSLAPRGIAADPTYSRKIEFWPMRVSVAQVQAVLDEASVLAHKDTDPLLRDIDAGHGIRHRDAISETIELTSGDETVTIPGHVLLKPGGSIPNSPLTKSALV
jgi:hypothetical protein